MRKSALFVALLTLVLMTACQTVPPGRLSQPRNVMLIGWDAAQRAHLQECLGRGELPALKQLSAEGTMVDIDIAGPSATDTKAGWTQILTGYEPAVTGVYNNRKYQPIPKGLSVFERLEDHFGKDNFVTVAVIGKKGHVDADPPVKEEVKKDDKKAEGGAAKPRKEGRPGPKGKAQKPRRPEGEIITENGIRYRVVPGKPYYYTKDGMDLFINGLTQNEKVGAKTMELLDQYKDKPFFFFVHFAEVDSQGHKFGENSQEYTDALISDDLWTGRIIDKLKELNLYDETLVYVTADHGFNEDGKGHPSAPNVFLATNDRKVMRNGLRVDITPTILDRFGVDLEKLQPPLDGHPLTKPYEAPKP